MNQLLHSRTARDSNFELLWSDGERVVYRGSRVGAGGERTSVLAMVPCANQPVPAILDRLAHEYGLRAELDRAWAARPLELVHEPGRNMLVLEDPGGEPLDRLLATPMEVGRFLQLAIAIAATLGRVHQRDLTGGSSSIWFPN